MISKKEFDADGVQFRFLSDFIIRSEQFCRVYNYIYDADGVEGDVDPSSGLYVRVEPAPSSEDLVTINKWDLVDNSISFYTAPFAGSSLWIEVATTAEEFGSTLIQPTVAVAVAAAEAAEASAAEALTSETNAASSEANSAASEAAAGMSEANAAASEASALLSKDEATASAASANNSASIATSAASAASTSETNAASSEANASASETNAAASEANAASSEANASASEAAAADSASSIDLNRMVASDPLLVSQPSTRVANMVEITQANYDLLTPDANTLYVIVG